MLKSPACKLGLKTCVDAYALAMQVAIAALRLIPYPPREPSSKLANCLYHVCVGLHLIVKLAMVSGCTVRAVCYSSDKQRLAMSIASFLACHSQQLYVGLTLSLLQKGKSTGLHLSISKYSYNSRSCQ